MLDNNVFKLKLGSKGGIAIREDGNKYYIVCIFKNNHIVVASFLKSGYNSVCKNHNPLACMFGDVDKFGVSGGLDNLLQNEANNDDYKKFLEKNSVSDLWNMFETYLDKQVNIAVAPIPYVGEIFDVMLFKREFSGDRMLLKRMKLKSWDGGEYLSGVTVEEVLRVMSVISKVA